jgi:Uma2 family endonuclease
MHLLMVLASDVPSSGSRRNAMMTRNVWGIAMPPHGDLLYDHARRYSMAMPAGHAGWTVDMLDALPDDGQRYELIDGELFVTPAPSDVHQLVVLELGARLQAYLRPSNVGRAIISPADVRRGDPMRNRVQPDVFVVRLANGGRPPYPYALSDLLLAVEVESASNPFFDHQTKRELYLTHGVPEYWIVNPAARTFVRWRTLGDPGETLTARIEWQPPGMAEPLVIDLPEFFDAALG